MKKCPQLHLLGPFLAKNSDGTAINFSHRKVLALLAYLAVEHERSHTREYLASLLWARTGDDRARHNLRQALSKLRSLCPDLVLTSGDVITLNPDASIIDISLFEASARSQDLDELQGAMQIYRGDLLEGYIAPETDYQDWLEIARTRLRKLAAATASRLTNLLIKQNRDEEAIEQLNRLLSFDRANESAHRELMTLLVKTGRRSDALRQFQTCITELAQELDVDPAPETRQLVEDIKQGKILTEDNGVDVEELQADTAVILAINLVSGSVKDGQDNSDQIQDAVNYAINRYSGKVLRQTKDKLLVRFNGADNALGCAFEIQRELKGAAQNSDGQISCRMGLDIGTLVRHQQGQLQGESINMAQRLAALVQPGDICLSNRVRKAASDHQGFDYQFIGEHQAHDVLNPVNAYRLNSHQQKQASDWSSDATPGFVLPGKPSLLLKPFNNMSDDAGQDYFAEGLTKDISIALTKIPGLFLAADETPRAQVSHGQNVRALGQKFGVRHVLCGGIRRHGSRVRVNAELINAATGQCIWGERYDRELSDLFTIQDEITEEIVTAMDVKLIQGEAARFMRRSLQNPAALEASYRGWYKLYSGTGHQDILEAQRLFEQVIQLEPDTPLGYVSAALAYWAEAGFGRVVVKSAAMQYAANLASKALKLGDTTGYANLILAVEHLARHEFDEAFAQSTEGVAARPNCNGAYAIKSSILNYLGRPKEAIEFAQYAVRLTPVYPAEFPAVLAACYHDSGMYSEAVDAAEASLRLRSNDIDPMLFLAAAKVGQSLIDEAREIADKIKHLDPLFRLSEFAGTQPYKNQDDLERLLNRLRESGLPE